MMDKTPLFVSLFRYMILIFLQLSDGLSANDTEMEL